ncbi:MAG: cytochrome c-type biogenesis protein CcmH [Candidatus Rokubacteria bacterium]|nr:cytochrome c-type biogenesis protein CcmH [Candidatus Rokubacteria bacterium]
MRAGHAAAAALVLAAALLAAPPAWLPAQPPARPVSEQAVHDIAAQLRCVVCQNLSVADSPSEMANQMRAIVRERLQAGESPAEVVQYFVDRYGEWILLSPRRRGFNWLVWLGPVVAVAAGLAIVAVLLWRWTRRARREAASPAAPSVDATMSERIRREMEAEP